MGLFTSKEFNSLEDLLEDQLQDLYDAENRLTKAIPKMVEAANSPDLKNAFQQHLRETEGQVKRLEQIFQRWNKKPSRETCQAMKGLIQEAEEAVEASGDPAVKDAALIASAQRVEHYEMAGYGTARSFAEKLGRSDVAQLLQDTLNEEKQADEKLTQIASQSVNTAAAT